MKPSTDDPHIVCLETMHCPLPPLDFPHKLTEHRDTPAHLVADRLRTATIAITTVIPITPQIISQCPSLRLIAIWATGTEWLDHAYCAEHGICVINCPGTNIEAVSEHALAFYFAARRKVVEMDGAMKERRLDGESGGEWVEKGTLIPRWEDVGGAPLSCGQEVVGIVGFGRLGRRIEVLCKGVGMGTVVVAGRKGVTGLQNGEEKAAMGVAVQRMPFEEVLRTATVLVICCPRDASTIDLIGEAELRSMRKEAIVVNVARSVIVNETALAKALTEGWIAAAATDVLEKEPGGRGTTPLLPLEGEVPNLTITPHVAWYAAQTMKNLKVLLKEALEGWMAGKPVNVVVQGP
jgi:lactate dehydrogenase-like 2-hydroxyacid dehydrogenase